MRFATLAEWLDWQETLHPRAIDLGLERPARVLRRLEVQMPTGGVVTIGGTNGKGSCVAFLDAMLRAAGRCTGAYTSPHLCHYNERICIDGGQATDAAIMDAFQRVDEARGEISLTYFEFSTLAAIWLFAQARCDTWVLEVGLGGRLDAVNIIDADVALISSIDLDHQDWLGTDRAAIGFEKAGIMRKNHPVVLGESDPPASVLAHARTVGARVLRLGRDFRFSESEGSWCWLGAGHRLEGLPFPAMAGRHQLANAACAIAALDALSPGSALPAAAIVSGLSEARAPGRFQIAPGSPEWVFDVAHNPAAAVALARNLAARPAAARTHVILGMLADKDVARFASALRPQVDRWYAADLSHFGRGLSDRTLQARLGGIVENTLAGTVEDACVLVDRIAAAEDRVVVCGSFHTVGAALRHRKTARAAAF
ncbi:MAG: bifunctional tetrahydrofolate synthase/dihydrofolate synthase [Gammaproteobacteria bacterium]|nr:bifunctional tetrahydrofolate synthase/dihydrofolate synthase [Gammaproteobacteria bacterium]